MASWKPFETFEIRGDTYVILSLVGEGVFSRVFETLRLLDNKIYAVKELTAYSTLPADAIRYFEQEVANLELLRGVPQVIQIVASEIIRQNIPENTGVFSSSKTSTDDRHNMLMLIVFEYAEISLSHYMHRKGKLDDPSIRKANSKVLHEECSGCVYKPVWSGPLKDDRVTIQYVWQSMVRCVLALHLSRCLPACSASAQAGGDFTAQAAYFAPKAKDAGQVAFFRQVIDLPHGEARENADLFHAFKQIRGDGSFALASQEGRLILFHARLLHSSGFAAFELELES